ncbi:LysE family translocator [Jannaschia seohaensis]|uniref:Threonine/homoserine/homoserine lactone efflux protein n=1 Tax=Jannaschia seohaensis TaxID=475081 RepID=A0A2Y9C7L7_9RHOB|nr:LysE family translocator [Jannaschia seohaensis]PWJ19371.1 threonine/homoserine/homoserine lactone efflux protein [Jannaschia seohaensis]SSA46033.1 Threonine/homoserine/homoserine lactone efflux protein [Jannaschia seohaensis]
MSVAVASFAVFAASQVGTPGPANMALMATGARFGFRRALPFVAGVALGKQLIIWPVGFGLMELAARAPLAFEALKWASAAYIVWLAWRVANMRLGEEGEARAPGFAAGLIVHPLNPKAWAMITAGFTGFVAAGTPTFEATLAIAAVLLACQIVLHPLWTMGGALVARTLRGRPGERYLMWTLAALTVASVLFVLFGGGPT